MFDYTSLRIHYRKTVLNKMRFRWSHAYLIPDIGNAKCQMAASEGNGTPCGPVAKETLSETPTKNRDIQEAIIAYESEAEKLCANAYAAESRGQIEDYDYYMDLADECLRKANDHRYEMSESQQKEDCCPRKTN